MSSLSRPTFPMQKIALAPMSRNPAQTRRPLSYPDPPRRSGSVACKVCSTQEIPAYSESAEEPESQGAPVRSVTWRCGSVPRHALGSDALPWADPRILDEHGRPVRSRSTRSLRSAWSTVSSSWPIRLPWPTPIRTCGAVDPERPSTIIPTGPLSCRGQLALCTIPLP